MGVKEDIIDYCTSLGVSSVGFAESRRFSELEDFYKFRKINGLENEFEENDIEKRINSKEWFEGGKTIVSIAFPYISLKKDKTANGFSLYTQGLDYHYVVNKYLAEIQKIIEGYGGKSKAFVDSNTLPERYLAFISGVGFIGKNNLIITKKHGSYVFLGEIVTDLEFYDEDKRRFEDIDKFEECGSCTICYGECPTKAINNSRKNCNICLSYITQKKELEDWEIEKLGGRMFGCDSCQLKCPYNQGIDETSIEEFKVMEFMDNCDDEFIINMNNSQFKETLKRTSCGWRGKNILKRNALIRRKMYLNKDIPFEGMAKIESQYLQDYLNRLRDGKS